MWKTIEIAIVGTFLGFILAIFTSYSTNWKFNNKIKSIFFGSIILFLRSIPELIFISSFTNMFNGYFALLLIFFWFSWLWLHKYFVEIFNNFDEKVYWQARKEGLSKVQAFKKVIWPRINNRIYNLFLYSFESNIRWSSILGILGTAGIGILINYGTLNINNFKELAIPVLVLTIFIGFLEIFNFFIKNYLLENKSKQLNLNKTQIYQKMLRQKNWRKITLRLIFIVLVIFSIVILCKINYFFLNSLLFSEQIKAFVQPDWSVFDIKSKQIELNPLLQLLQSFNFAFLITLLMIISFLILLPFYSKLIFGKWKSLICKLITVIVRTIPIVVFFYIFNSLFYSSLTLLILTLTTHQNSAILKQLWEKIDNFQATKFFNLRLQNYSKFHIYWKYMLPEIKGDLYSLLMLYFEISFRNSITYSVLTSQELVIGTKIIQYNSPNGNFDLNKTFAYIWIGIFGILFINIINIFLNKKILRDMKFYLFNCFIGKKFKKSV
ncbi:ABC transporter permease subunit [Mycoplasmopsis iners]|uniref:ABC transporter permease subunit n=1 Tax=Mycoplasmopsis iners TaxID=76630 RepID=UPI00068BCFF6|nr:ABC transporter permease subunit [Mycoplasmopsis iners]